MSTIMSWPWYVKLLFMTHQDVVNNYFIARHYYLQDCFSLQNGSALSYTDAGLMKNATDVKQWNIRKTKILELASDYF